MKGGTVPRLRNSLQGDGERSNSQTGLLAPGESPVARGELWVDPRAAVDKMGTRKIP